jgi:uncharacterized protein involved in response to NO
MPTSLRLADGPPVAPAEVPAWAAKGFRPFFLLAGAFAALIVPAWLLALRGGVRVDGYLDPMMWHAHEMVFGFAVAVIAGFLLTAVGNWTGRETAIGAPLVGLALLWVAGRVVFATAGAWPPVVVAITDLAFLPALAATIAVPLIAARARRNYPMLALLGALWGLDLVMHLDVLGIAPGWRWPAGIAAAELVALMVLMFAGRVFPMFTRNATGVASIRNRPNLDRAVIPAMLALVVLDLAAPGHRAAPVIAGVAAVLALARSWSWGARHTARHPLLWILHAAHAWIVVGLALRAAAAWTPRITMSSWLHALTAGAVGAATLGMMARVALGHSGRRLAVGRATTVAFVAITVAAALRVVAPIHPPAYRAALEASGALWTLAFVVFVVAYARILTTPRADGKPG